MGKQGQYEIYHINKTKTQMLHVAAEKKARTRNNRLIIDNPPFTEAGTASEYGERSNRKQREQILQAILLTANMKENVILKINKLNTIYWPCPDVI